MSVAEGCKVWEKALLAFLSAKKSLSEQERVTPMIYRHVGLIITWSQHDKKSIVLLGFSLCTFELAVDIGQRNARKPVQRCVSNSRPMYVIHVGST